MNGIHRLKYFALLIAIMAIYGCGGGGNSNVTGTLAVSVTAPTAFDTVTGIGTGSIAATYTPINGKNPAGLDISFSTNQPGVVFLSSSTQKVGSDGTATITFNAQKSKLDVLVKVYATTGGLSQFQEFTIAGDPLAPPPPPPPSTVSPAPQSISFVAASPAKISLKGSGTTANPETSLVSFLVKDTAGNPLTGITVDFFLNTAVGGITITPASGITDSTGTVTTIVTAGTMATTVQVTATVRTTTITTKSTQLVIASGPPDQDSLSISMTTHYPEAWDIDGITVTVIARLADHFNNPVADGTAVYFTTDGGSIVPSCTTVGGACSVLWTSQLPHPTGIMNGAVPINDGTVAVLAYAVGEESFTDVNNNGLADGGACTAIPWLTGVGQAQQCGEFIDTPDAYRDDNFNGVHDANEPFYNLTGLPSYTGFDSLYEGAFQPAASTNPRSKYIFFNSYLIMSRSTPAIVSLSDTNVPLLSVSTASVPVILTVADSHGNPMPSGTTITPTVNAGCTACIKISPSTAIKVPTTNATTQYPLLLSNSCATSTCSRDTIIFAVKVPSGLETIPPAIQIVY